MILSLLFVAAIAGLKAQDLSWELTENSGAYRLTISDLPGQLTDVPEGLQVFVGVQEAWPGQTVPAILGEVTVRENGLTFQPRFPFRKGISYTAFWKKGAPFQFQIPHPEVTTELLAIYPSVETVPANLLKIYLHFSAPMGEGRAYEHLTLLNVVGDTVYQPFVPLQPELWSEDRRRLTLWLDPGRVKRGLLSHETHGVVIEEGEEYQLQIAPDWKDASGVRLGKPYFKRLIVGSPDYDRPVPAGWRLHLPNAGSSDPLVIDFGESLDQALASRHLKIQTESGLTVPGSVTLSQEESRWSFYPESAWPAGNYSVLINSSLEDLAGNNLNRPFDREIKPGEAPAVAQDFQTIEFHLQRSE